MKKIVLLFCTLCLLLSGCGGGETAAATTEPPAVTDSGPDVELTLPQELLEHGGEGGGLTRELLEDGFKTATLNEDGSVTYTIGKADYDRLLAQTKDHISETLRQVEQNRDFPSIVEVTHNDDFTVITMAVDRGAYDGSMDHVIAPNLSFQGSLYQLYLGVAHSDIQVRIDVADKDTGEVFDSLLFPEE